MKKTSKKNEIAQTLQQAAKLLDVPLSEVKLAKRSGAACFLASGRVNVTELREYLLEHPPGGSPTASGAGSEPPPAPVDLSSLTASLEAAISVEERNLQLLRSAQDRRDSVAVAALSVAFEKSQRNRLSYERAVREEKQRRGELIPIDVHRIEGFRMWRPILDCIRRIPRKAALEIEGDHVLVERVLDRAVEAAIGEAKAMLTFPDEQQKQLAAQLFVMAMCDDDRNVTTQTLENIDGLRKLVVEELARQAGAKPQPAPENAEITSEF